MSGAERAPREDGHAATGTAPQAGGSNDGDSMVPVTGWVGGLDRSHDRSDSLRSDALPNSPLSGAEATNDAASPPVVGPRNRPKHKPIRPVSTPEMAAELKAAGFGSSTDASEGGHDTLDDTDSDVDVGPIGPARPLRIPPVLHMPFSGAATAGGVGAPTPIDADLRRVAATTSPLPSLSLPRPPSAGSPWSTGAADVNVHVFSVSSPSSPSSAAPPTADADLLKAAGIQPDHLRPGCLKTRSAKACCALCVVLVLGTVAVAIAAGVLYRGVPSVEVHGVATTLGQPGRAWAFNSSAIAFDATLSFAVVNRNRFSVAVVRLEGEVEAANGAHSLTVFSLDAEAALKPASESFVVLEVAVSLRRGERTDDRVIDAWLAQCAQPRPMSMLREFPLHVAVDRFAVRLLRSVASLSNPVERTLNVACPG